MNKIGITDMHLRPKIALTILPIIILQVIVLLIPSFILYQQYYGDKVKGQINDSIMQVQNALDAQLTSVTSNSAIFSQSVILNRYLLTEDESIRFNVMHKVLVKEFSSFINAHSEYIEISLIMPDGYEEVSLMRNGVANITDEEQDTDYFKNIVESESDVEINTLINPDTGKWALISARKIYQTNTIEQSATTPKKIKGYLIIKTDFSFIAPLLKNNSLLTNGFAIIHDATGTPVLTTTEKKLQFNNQLKIFNESEFNYKPQLSTWSIDNESYIVGQKKMMDNLFFSIGWSKSELSPLLKNMLYTSMQNSLLLIICSALILFWILNKQLVIPILKLSIAAKKMGSEGIWILESKSNDELNDLAATIKNMGLSLIEQKQKVHDIAYIDSLTQLPNRRQFTDVLAHQYKDKNTERPEIALLFIDLDGFKDVNDTNGHGVGDSLLISVASRLNNVLRAQDKIDHIENISNSVQHHVARLGGDEFTIILKGIKDRNAAEHVARRILNAFSSPFTIAESDFSIGSSIGIAMASECDGNAAELLKNADTAMYESKAMGKNTYRFYTPKQSKATHKPTIKENVTK